MAKTNATGITREVTSTSVTENSRANHNGWALTFEVTKVQDKITAFNVDGNKQGEPVNGMGQFHTVNINKNVHNDNIIMNFSRNAFDSELVVAIMDEIDKIGAPVETQTEE